VVYTVHSLCQTEIGRISRHEGAQVPRTPERAHSSLFQSRIEGHIFHTTSRSVADCLASRRKELS